MGTFKTLAAAGILTIMGTLGAQAATLTLQGGNNLTFGTGNYDAVCEGGDVTKCYNPSGAAGALALNLTTFDSTTAPPGLYLDTAAKLTVTFLGKEAGAENFAFTIAGGQISNEGPGTTYTTTVGAGAVDFAFSSPELGTLISNLTGTVVGNPAMGFSDIFNDGKSVYAFFDDSGANVNRDYDDMAVLISVEAAPVPLPAGLLLLGTGLAGLGLARRARKS